MNSKTVVILANGQFPTHEIPLNILNSANDIICCDGAVDSLSKNTNLNPALIIGDLDSLSDEAKIKFSDRLVKIENQNTNDLTKAFEYALEKKYEKIIFLGTSGSREDHQIANFFLFFDFAKHAEIEVYTDHGKFTSVRDHKKIESFPQQPISFFTESSDVILTCTDLKWPLINKKFDRPWTGALNESLADELDIFIESGVCLVFQTYK
jgi:thiamine pyrophosphokinase